MGQRRYPECVAREGKRRLRSLEEVVALPRRSPLAAELQGALAAASRLHGLRSDLSPVPVRATTTISEAGAYRFRLKDPIDLRVSRVGGRSALGFLHELGHFMTARWTGMKATQFFIGFGPRLWSFRKGETVFHQGDPGDALFIMASGSVKVVLPSDEGAEPAIVAILGPGEFFGELAILDGAPHSATIVP